MLADTGSLSIKGEKGQAERCTELLQELRRKHCLKSRRKLEENKHFVILSFVRFCTFGFDFYCV